MFFLKRVKNKLVRIIGGSFLSFFELILYENVGSTLSHPPVFFLGAPRSGTTLAMQVITDVFDIGYISNFHCRFFGAPALAEVMFHPIDGRPRSSYSSVHGKTDAPYAPSECGEWWYRFFRRSPRYVDLPGASERKMACFRGSVASLIHAFRKPVVFKNPHAALRIQPIAKYIPEALFIIMERDELDNAHSLLEVRKKVYGTYDKWWSMEPPQFKELEKLSAHEQVIEQIRDIYSTINNDLDFSGIASSNCFTLKYEQLCQDPEKEMKRLDQFFKLNNCEVQRLHRPPEPFIRRDEVRIDLDLFENVKKYAQKP